jgi:hypothetical protein
VSGSQAVDPFGRWARRTWTQPGLVAITGSTEGRSYQLAGTLPEATCPGLAYLGAFRSTVASTVLAGAPPGGMVLGAAVLGGTLPAGAVPPGTGSCRSLAACLASGACDGPATAAAGPPAEGPPPDESSSPAEAAPAATATTLTVIAARFFRFGAAPT